MFGFERQPAAGQIVDVVAELPVVAGVHLDVDVDWIGGHIALHTQSLPVLHVVANADFNGPQVPKSRDYIAARPVENVHKSFIVTTCTHDPIDGGGDVHAASGTARRVMPGIGQDEVLLEQHLGWTKPVVAKLPPTVLPRDLDLFQITVDVTMNASRFSVYRNAVLHPDCPVVPRVMRYQTVEPRHRFVQLHTGAVGPDDLVVAIPRRP